MQRVFLTAYFPGCPAPFQPGLVNQANLRSALLCTSRLVRPWAPAHLSCLARVDWPSFFWSLYGGRLPLLGRIASSRISCLGSGAFDPGTDPSSWQCRLCVSRCFQWLLLVVAFQWRMPGRLLLVWCWWGYVQHADGWPLLGLGPGARLATAIVVLACAQTLASIPCSRAWAPHTGFCALSRARLV